MFSLILQIYKVMLKGLLKIMPYIFAFSTIYSVILLMQESAHMSDIITAIILMLMVNYFVWNRFKNKFRKVNYDSLTGEEFEDFCVSLLKANGFYNVSKTKSSGDHGIDVLATKNGKRYAIQCKRYSNNIGNKAVQEAYSGKDIYGSDVAVVMTNQYFTKQAINDARKLNVQLWDRNELVKLISSSRNKNIFNLFEKKSEDSLWKNETWGIPEQEKKDNYSESFIESYAKECCALMEHEDEMQSCMEHFNIKNE